MWDRLWCCGDCPEGVAARSKLEADAEADWLKERDIIYQAQHQGEPRCRECGCFDGWRCSLESCTWAEADLCSTCARKQGKRVPEPVWPALAKLCPDLGPAPYRAGDCVEVYHPAPPSCFWGEGY